MNIDRIPDIRPEGLDEVTAKICGNMIEVRYMPGNSAGCVIEKLSADLYVDRRTGEVKEFRHNANRAGDKASVALSLRKLRDLINANLKSPDSALWVTLTYAENMTDPTRLYQDYRRFWGRFKYYLSKQGYPTTQYITAAEPQGRGALHLHCLFCFSEKAPFIPNADIARLWGHGFTKTKSLKGMDNPGLYLTAYLGDMELSEIDKIRTANGQLKAVEVTDENGQKIKKAIIKGARLCLYPPGFNIYRTSRNIKRPQIYHMTENEAQKLVGTAPLTYEKTVAVRDGAGKIQNIINYRTYTKGATPRNVQDQEADKAAQTETEG